MEKIKIKIKKLDPQAKVPLIGSEHAAAFDLYSLEDYEIAPGETKAIRTGIAMEIPVGKCCQIWDRSGMGIKGIHRFAGLIDSDYRGEFKIVLHNHNKEPFKINKGDRIAQGMILDHYQVEFEEVIELSNTLRGSGAFGSTGLN